MTWLSRIARTPRESFGLDIGTSSVKAVQLRERYGTFTLTALGLAPLPVDAIGDGTIKTPQVVADAIREAVARAGIRAREAVIGIAGRELITKKVQLPAVPAKELRDAVELEAEHHIPFAFDEVCLDYHVAAERAGVMDLVIVAVKKTKVNEYVAVVEEAGFSPAVVDVDSFAVGNQFEVNQPETTGDAVALIDMGAAVMKTNVLRGGSPSFARDIPFGGNQYTQAIADRLRTSFEHAERAKLGEASDIPWENIVPALESISRDLALEVRRTFDYFGSTTDSERIGRVVMSGGAARLRGLTEYLSSTWSIPVEVARPFERIEVDPVFGTEARNLGPALAVAVGLALRRPRERRG
jgi:type IV pilus assembly protein PilM